MYEAYRREAFERDISVTKVVLGKLGVDMLGSSDDSAHSVANTHDALRARFGDEEAPLTTTTVTHELQATCSHPDHRRKVLPYATICQDCGARLAS